jgi:UDP-N-acetylglucosamine acyltransferase
LIAESVTTGIHPSALIHPSAALAQGVEVGPFAVVGPNVSLGAGTKVGPHAVIECTRLGRRCVVGAGAILGAAPQDTKYRGTETTLEVGDDTVIREYATLHRGTEARGRTSVGAHCFLMTYVHVAHDCVIEDHVTIANMVQLAGHVHIESHATISGLCPVHQFVRIGTYAYVGGGSRVPQDVPPYTTAVGNPLKLYGINSVGLTRAGFSSDLRLELKRAYRLLFNSDLSTSEAARQLKEGSGASPEVQHLAQFLSRTERGVLA